MGKKYRNLYASITDIDNLRLAYYRASLGKKSSWGYLAFKENAEANLHEIQSALQDHTWSPSPMRHFMVYEPKPRNISAPSFADRVVHHALCAVIEPIFDATFLPTSFACRDGKGTHAGVKWVQSQLRRNDFTYYLKTDFRKFFPSVDCTVLHAQFAKKISCKQTMWLLRQIIPVDQVGIPIGALTSQLSANIYGNVIDHHLHHVLKVPFARYMDDIVVLSDDQSHLRFIKAEIERLGTDQLHLTISRWNIGKTSTGIDFLGYRIWKKHKLLRRASVVRAKRKIRKLIQIEDKEPLRRFLGSWLGHAQWADTANLRRWLRRYIDSILEGTNNSQ